MTNHFIPLHTEQTSFFGIDDRAYARGQSRKRAPTPDQPVAAPEGPCCVRCWNWLPPKPGEPFGACTVACVVTAVEKGAGFGVQRGTVLLAAEARIPGVEWEFLRTRAAHAGCSRFGAETPAGERAA